MTRSVRQALSNLLSDRIEEYHQSLHELQPVELAHHLSEMCGVGIDKTEALIEGEPVELEDEELRAIATQLELHEDVLRCLLASFSAEISSHVLKRVVAPTLNTGECGMCQQLAAKIEQCSTMEVEELAQLMLGVLEHLAVQSGPGDCESEEGDDDEALADNLMAVFYSLDREAQMRVLASAYAEAGGRLVANPIGGMYVLRSECESQLLLRVLDQLAEQGSVPEKQLAAAIGLRDARALAHLQTIWEHSLTKVRDLGYHIDASALRVTQSALGERVYSLEQESSDAWRSLGLASERALRG